MSKILYLVKSATIYNREAENSALIIPVTQYGEIGSDTTVVRCKINQEVALIEVPSIQLFERLDEALTELQKLLNPPKSIKDENISV